MKTGLICGVVALAMAWSPPMTGEPPDDLQDARPDPKVLLDADRAFDADTAADGLDGWMRWFAPGAVVPIQTGALVDDADELRAWYESNAFPPPGFHWWPELAELSASGDYGYTVGAWELRPAGGAPSADVELPGGRYLTVWQRQPDGGYRVVTDGGDTPGFRASWPHADGPPLEWSSRAERTWRAEAGDFVFVLGSWSAGSGPTPHRGRHITVWKRADAGGWEIATETGFELPPAGR